MVRLCAAVGVVEGVSNARTAVLWIVPLLVRVAVAVVPVVSQVTAVALVIRVLPALTVPLSPAFSVWPVVELLEIVKVVMPPESPYRDRLRGTT